ncbi:MAG TPA: AraC family transcriptional regulator [Solirubrobacterales bacterium]|nr:AraC family transcriptional regulator [Solirubrobacterales bacterium]
MARAGEDRNRRLLRARDAIDRSYATPLDVAALARVAHVSPAHFARQFRAVFGETPHRYLQRRRIERAMELLRDTDRPVTEVCLDVGFASLGTFSRTFSAVVGESPSAYRERTAASRRGAGQYVPACVEKTLRRPVGDGADVRRATPGPAPEKRSSGEAEAAAAL